MTGGGVVHGRTAAVALAVLALGCSKKARPDAAPAEPMVSAPAPAPADTVPPVALAAEPVSAFADAAVEPGATPYEQARAYHAQGQHWLARLVLEKKALGADATEPELELLAAICHAQSDEACVAECSRRAGRAIEHDGGAPPAAALPREHVEPDTDLSRARDLVLRGKLAEARAILEPAVLGEAPSREQVRLLRKVCSDQGDRMCAALCDAKLR